MPGAYLYKRAHHPASQVRGGMKTHEASSWTMRIQKENAILYQTGRLKMK
jgi:hypothetical protein